MTSLEHDDDSVITQTDQCIDKNVNKNLLNRYV